MPKDHSNATNTHYHTSVSVHYGTYRDTFVKMKYHICIIIA